jgi:hypothetical protein
MQWAISYFADFIGPGNCRRLGCSLPAGSQQFDIRPDSSRPSGGNQRSLTDLSLFRRPSRSARPGRAEAAVVTGLARGLAVHSLQAPPCLLESLDRRDARSMRPRLLPARIERSLRILSFDL